MRATGSRGVRPGACCTGCGHQLGAERSAADALRFALMIAGSGSVHDDFWTRAAVAHVYGAAALGAEHRRVDAIVEDLSTPHVPPHAIAEGDAPISLGGAVRSPAPGSPEESNKKGDDGPAASFGAAVARTNPYAHRLLRDGIPYFSQQRLPDHGTVIDGARVRCEVDQWHLPEDCNPSPPDGHQVSEKDPIVGFHFTAAVVFKHAPPTIRCECCVLRTFVRKTLPSPHGGSSSSPPTAGTWELDKQSDGRIAGGARVDGSTVDSHGSPTPPDNPDLDVDQVPVDPCVVDWDDSPGIPSSNVRLGTRVRITYDFVGIVYDRCNFWAYVDSRRMLLTREFYASWAPFPGQENARADESELGLIPDSGSASASRNVPPDAEWDPAEVDEAGSPKPLPGQATPCG